MAAFKPLRIAIEDGETATALVKRVSNALRDLESHATAPLFDVARASGIEPARFLDTLFVTWSFASEDWHEPAGLRIAGGRSVTSTATRLAILLSGAGDAWELAVASSAFHRAGRARTHLLALLDLFVDAPNALVSTLLDASLFEGGMSVAIAPL